jgi:hypothetical protein
MQDHFETVTVHAPALVARRDMGQTVRRLKDVAPPNVGAPCPVQIHTLIRCTLNADLFEPGHIQVFPHPAGEVLICRVSYLFVEQAIVQKSNAIFECGPQPVHFTARKVRPFLRQGASDLCQEAVPVEPARPVPLRKDVYVSGCFENSRRTK